MARFRGSPRSPSWPGRAITVIGVAVSLAAAALSIVRPRFLSSLDNLFFDSVAREEQAASRCRLPVVVTLDDEALARFGHWPWPRALFARLLHRLAALHPSSVGVDVLFPEPEGRATDGRPSPSPGDRALAQSLAAGPFVLGWEFTFGAAPPPGGGTPGPLAVHIASLGRGTSAAGRLWSASGALASTPELTRSVDSGGFLNAGLDRDGVLRRMPVVIEHGRTLHPSLALAVALKHLGQRQAVLESSYSGDHVLRAGGRRIPLDGRGRLLLRYRCGVPTRLSAAAVLDGRVPAAEVQGRPVFVGAAGTGFGESVATPIGPTVPGVVAHAITAGNILEADFAREGPPLLAAALVLGMGLAATAASLRMRVLPGALLLAAAAAAAWQGAEALFHARGLIVSPVLPIAVLAAHGLTLALVRARHHEQRADLQGRDLAATRHFVTEALASLAAIRDTETGGHLQRTQHYVRILCEAAARHPRFRRALTPDAIDLISRLAPLHDIGKVGVPDHLLRKPARLTAEERDIVRQHARHGFDAIANAQTRVGVHDAEFLRVAKELAHSHHEHWDGTGYPEGTKGDEIPLAGRVMAIADVYDALVSRRVYKEALPHEEAVAYIQAGRGRQFDPDLVDAFLGIHDRWRQIHRQLTDAGEAAGLRAAERPARSGGAS